MNLFVDAVSVIHLVLIKHVAKRIHVGCTVGVHDNDIIRRGNARELGAG